MKAGTRYPLSQEPSSGQDIESEVCRLIREGIHTEGAEISICFNHAPISPPITLESMTVLEMSRIINDPKLRHDINFVPELHFEPNLDGIRGEKTEDYWKALRGELFVYARVQKGLSEANSDADFAQAKTHWTALRTVSEKRVPILIKTIRDILRTLVPADDQEAVKHCLNADLMMKEIRNGYCCFPDLVDWLAKILKKYCAPMRDKLVDRMRNEILRGVVEGCANTLVVGIRQLLSILETMKLDVVNHEIRHVRPSLIDGTINFERYYHAHRIEMGHIEVTQARKWLECEIATMAGAGAAPTPLEALTFGLLRSLLNKGVDRGRPQTFQLDSTRLEEVKNDMDFSIFHELIRDILHKLILRRSLSQKAFDEISVTLKAKITAIVGAGCKFVDRTKYIAAELMRFVLKIEGNDASAIDAELLSYFEQRLLEDLCPNSPAFNSHAKTTLERILPKLQNSVAAHVKLPAMLLHDRLVPALASKPPIGMGAVCVPPLLAPPHPDDDIMRRLTHVVVLHWRIWADPVYLCVPQDNPESESSSAGPTPPSSRSTSPTVPVAEATFDAVRRWLPIGIETKSTPDRRSSPSDSNADALSRPTSPSFEPISRL